MLRPVIDSEDGARADLGPARRKPAWLAAVRTLPFTFLSPDEFEVFCYLLLRREYPDERIFYYGKTGDGGRDILRPQSPKGCELIQCKRYAKDVGIGELRKELAKLCSNVFSGEIPDHPMRVTFYVSRDLTAPAKDLLRDQSRWIGTAEGALREHLGHDPDAVLMEFARTWWPEVRWESEIDLTQRVKRQPELLDEFFAVQPVVTGSMVDVRRVVREELDAREVRIGLPGPDQGWEAFFRAVGQEDQVFFYLNDWPGLPPDQRFVAPKELPKIREALSREPLTFLIGPLAAGKTFTAVQLLWEAWQQGRRVHWIAPPTYLPTEGPIPAEHGSLDMEGRIRWLVHHLGQPRDASDFISKLLEPDSLVYIEDPFGKRDDEFSSSLHTYRFFDLDRFVETLCDNAARANCHILVTSRTGLFERWLEDRKAVGKSRPPSALIRIDSESYEIESRITFAIRIAEARKFEKSEAIAREIARRVRFPFEIETIIFQLLPEATAEDAATAANNWCGGLVAAVLRQLQPGTGGERLLLVVAALEWPLRGYCQLYSDLKLPGDSEKALASALLRFGAFIYRKPFPFFLRGSSRQDGGYQGLSDSLAASHSSITEAIRYILGADQEWLERMAIALRTTGARNADVAVFLLSLGIGKTIGRAQDAIVAILFEEKGLTSRQEADFARIWPSCDTTFREKLFLYLQTDQTQLVRGLAARLAIVDVQAEDAWRLLRLLLKERYLVRGGQLFMDMFWSHPWWYLGEHIKEMPEDFRRSLEELAGKDPALFTYALGEILVERWSAVPETFKSALLSRAANGNAQTQEKVLPAITRKWEDMPQELQDFFLRQSSHEEWTVRAAAALAAWIYHDDNPAVFDQVFMKAVDDPDVRVPLEVLTDSGGHDYDRRFAEALLRRVNGEEALEMLWTLTKRGMDPEPGWKLDIIQACTEKGGDLARGVLAQRYFSSNPQRPLPFFTLRVPLGQETESVRLGAINAYAESHGRRTFLSEEELIILIEGLPMPYRYWGLFYLSLHLFHLPETVRDYIEGFEGTESEVGDAVREGREMRQPKEQYPYWKFPFRWLTEELKAVSPSEASSAEI